ncbi:MAG: hypothetical protein JOZ49_13430 [Mycolicibacterium sp.]|nr:hypothetical protein [Mycolicibacterium sp.]
MSSKAKQASDAVGQLLEAVYEWEDAADAFFATGSDDDDVIVTHDSMGRLVECTLRPGLQQELTTAELEEAICDAITANVGRAQEGLDKLLQQFRERCEAVAASVGAHPVGDEMGQALRRN